MDKYLYDFRKYKYVPASYVEEKGFDTYLYLNEKDIGIVEYSQIDNDKRYSYPVSYDQDYFIRLGKRLKTKQIQMPLTGSVNQEKVNKNENTFLDILKQYKEELNFVTNQQEQIRKERLVFLNEKVKEVSKSLKDIGIGGDIINEWLKKLVESYTASLDVSGKLVDECAARIFKEMKALQGETEK